MNGRARFLLAATAAVATLGAAVLLPGCDAGGGPLAPRPTPLGEAVGTAAASENEPVPASSAEPGTVTWTVVASKPVVPDSAAVVARSRYRLQFPPRSVDALVTVTIAEHDPFVADVEFGPDGARFSEPVWVTIDYHDTALDPASGRFKGLPLGVFWYNPATGAWEPIPFEVDEKLKKVRFVITHFSRYGLTDAVAGDEWQWNRTGGTRDRISGQ